MMACREREASNTAQFIKLHKGNKARQDAPLEGAIPSKSATRSDTLSDRLSPRSNSILWKLQRSANSVLGSRADLFRQMTRVHSSRIQPLDPEDIQPGFDRSIRSNNKILPLPQQSLDAVDPVQGPDMSAPLVRVGSSQSVGFAAPSTPSNQQRRSPLSAGLLLGTSAPAAPSCTSPTQLPGNVTDAQAAPCILTATGATIGSSSLEAGSNTHSGLPLIHSTPADPPAAGPVAEATEQGEAGAQHPGTGSSSVAGGVAAANPRRVTFPRHPAVLLQAADHQGPSTAVSQLIAAGSAQQMVLPAGQVAVEAGPDGGAATPGATGDSLDANGALDDPGDVADAARVDSGAQGHGSWAAPGGGAPAGALAGGFRAARQPSRAARGTPQSWTNTVGQLVLDFINPLVWKMRKEVCGSQPMAQCMFLVYVQHGAMTVQHWSHNCACMRYVHEVASYARLFGQEHSRRWVSLLPVLSSRFGTECACTCQHQPQLHAKTVMPQLLGY